MPAHVKQYSSMHMYLPIPFCYKIQAFYNQLLSVVGTLIAYAYAVPSLFLVKLPKNLGTPPCNFNSAPESFLSHSTWIKSVLRGL